MNKWFFPVLASFAVTLAGISGCNSTTTTSTTSTDEKDGKPAATSALKGAIKIDGSSTVYKITASVAEKFMDANPDVDVTVAVSGTGGGFKKFIAKETDISNASRPIEEDEIADAKTAGVEYVEVPIGYDGLTLVVNKQNDWVDHLTTAELKKIFEDGSTVKTWKDIRATWPAEPIKLYSPGTDSGTFDFFTEVITGKKGNMRKDASFSEDDNQLAKGVGGDKGGLGFFGIAYYEANMDTLKAVPIDAGSGPVEPNFDNVLSLKYQPLSRPEFIYISKTAFDRPEVKAFAEFYIGAEGQATVKESGYVPFKSETYTRIQKMFAEGKTGSHFQGMRGKPVEDVLTAAGY